MNATDILTHTLDRPIRTNSLRNHQAIIKLTAKNRNTNKATTNTKELPLTHARVNPHTTVTKIHNQPSSPLSHKQALFRNKSDNTVKQPTFDSRQRTPIHRAHSDTTSSSNKKSTAIRKKSLSKKTPPFAPSNKINAPNSTAIFDKTRQTQKPNALSRSKSAEKHNTALCSSAEPPPVIPPHIHFEKIEELELPWTQYLSESTMHDNNQINIPDFTEARNTATEDDYDKLLQELDSSHAALTASQFETISISEAEELKKKLQRMKPALGSLYERIRIQLDTQHASATLQKLDNNTVGHILNANSSPSADCKSMFEYLSDIQQASHQTCALLDEFFFTSQSVHNMELRYFQHLAGTLALYQQHRISNDEAIVLLTNILHKIESLIPDVYNNRDGDVVDKEQQQANTCTSSKTASCASSVSSISSWSSGSYSVASSKDSADTAATAVTLDAEDRPVTSNNVALASNRSSSGIYILVQKIEQALERLSLYLKNQQEELSKNNGNSAFSAAQEELARQRERSANLVMEMDRHRSQRGLLMKDENNVAYLKNQLCEEAKRRQSLKERIASLEQLVEKSKDDARLQKSTEEQIEKLKLVIEQQKGKLAQQELYHQEREKELMELKDKYLAEKHIWTLTEQLILEKCNVVLDDDSETSSDCKEAVTRLVDRYMAARQKLRAMSQRVTTPYAKEEDDAEKQKETTLRTEILALEKEKQDLLMSLQEEKKIVECEKEALAKERDSLQQLKYDIVNEKQALKNERKTFEEEKLQVEKIKKSIPNSGENAGVTLRNDLEEQLNYLREAFKKAQQTYTTRESAFMLQSASTEAELERLLKEYDRLTRNIVDFNTERKKLEDEIEELCQDKLQLEKQVTDQQVLALSENSLRKEFRELMASVKENHSEALLKELGKRRQLEQELRDVKADIEMKRWDQVSVGVQTTFDFASTMLLPESADLIKQDSDVEFGQL